MNFHCLVHSIWVSMPVSNQEQSNTTVMKENISKSIKVNRCFTLYFIFAMFMGSACNPDLVGDPPMGRTEETYFSNATEFRTKLVSVYASLYDHYHFAANEIGRASCRERV